MGSLLVPCIPELIQELRLLLKESAVVLASSEDADYFRTSFKKSSSTPHSTSKPPPFGQAQSNVPLSHAEKSSNAVAAFDKPNPSEPSPSLKKKETDFTKTQEDTLRIPIAEHPPTKVIPKPTIPNPIERGIDKGMMTLVKAVMPHLAILEEIPDDSLAKRIATRWKTKNQCAPICVLSSTELPQYQTFLQDLAGALDVYFGPAKIVDAGLIEQEKQWEPFLSTEGLKLLVVCDTTLWQLHHLRQFYKENPAQGSRTIGKIPLFLLPDLSLYFKDPLLKKSLWKALCQKCS